MIFKKFVYLGILVELALFPLISWSAQPGDPIFIQELAKSISEIPAANVLKADRFWVWWKEIDGVKYVFKKRQPGKSAADLFFRALEFGKRQNVSRFDEAQRLERYLAEKGIDTIRVPKIFKVVFNNDSLAESDWNTGIVEEFIKYPDIMNNDFSFNIDPASISNELYEDLITVATDLGVDDLHYGNLKYDAVHNQIWISDLEMSNINNVEIINESILWRPLRGYLNWQLKQDRKYDGGKALAYSLENFGKMRGFAVDARFSANMQWVRKESIKIATAVVLFKIARFIYESPYRGMLKIAYVSNLIDIRQGECPSCDLNETVRASVRSAVPTESREEVFNLFATLYVLTNSLEDYIKATPKIDVKDEFLLKIEQELSSIERKLCKLWSWGSVSSWLSR